MSGDRSEDRAEILRLKARYLRFFDTKQWEQWRALLAPQFRFYLDDEPFPVTADPLYDSADAFVGQMSRSHRSSVTIHQGHMPEIEFSDDRHATGVWAMSDWVDDPEFGRAFQGFGHYHDEFEKDSDGSWRISSIRLTRLRVNSVEHMPSEGNKASLRKGEG